MSTQIEEIRERCEKATEGPWHVVLGSGHHLMTAVRSEVADEIIADCLPDWVLKEGCAPADHRDNMRFIAHARQDVPWLLSEIDRLRGLLDEAVEHLEDDKRTNAQKVVLARDALQQGGRGGPQTEEPRDDG